MERDQVAKIFRNNISVLITIGTVKRLLKCCLSTSSKLIETLTFKPDFSHYFYVEVMTQSSNVLTSACILIDLYGCILINWSWLMICHF